MAYQRNLLAVLDCEMLISWVTILLKQEQHGILMTTQAFSIQELLVQLLLDIRETNFSNAPYRNQDYRQVFSQQASCKFCHPRAQEPR